MRITIERDPCEGLAREWAPGTEELDGTLVAGVVVHHDGRSGLAIAEEAK
jgi:hypothetical protein